MDPSVNSAVSASLVMQQAQTLQQAQMQIFREALDTQQTQVTALMESATTQSRLATDGSVGTQIDTYA
ncbi:putative motility protein [Litchfieldella xinjiangensis]|uniref:putative motility protein n=1 Tax=Litchfieldella xinjiangensis TaxID=1166948 RepID=UPI0005BE8E2F|nr:putative motility protein [Halomonas xinjiangensis]